MNLLLFKLRYIGDVLLTTPAVSLVRQAHPNDKITMVVNKGTEDILKYNTDLNEVIVVEKTNKYKNLLTILKQLRKTKYDISIDFASGDRAAWLALWSGAKLRIGLLSNEGFRRWINNCQVKYLESSHTVNLYIAIASEAPAIKSKNIKLQNSRLKLIYSEEDAKYARSIIYKNKLKDKNYVTVHLGCRYHVNKWGINNWVNLLNKLNIPVVFIGTQNDNETIREVSSNLKVKNISLAGGTTILQTAAVIAYSSGFIGHDSGPMHISAAMNVPVIGIFGKESNPVAWHPWTDNYVIISTNQSADDVYLQAKIMLTPKL